jgi:hypothetical protein
MDELRAWPTFGLCRATAALLHNEREVGPQRVVPHLSCNV